MNVCTDLDSIYKMIHRELAGTRERIFQILKTHNPLAQDAVQYFFRAPGKLLRPALCLLAARFGEPNPDLVISVSAGLEILHSATLVHDDIVDDARLRRNLPTLNVRWGPQAAVLLGDYLYDRAFHTFFKTRNERVIDLMLEVARQVCEGEILELETRGNMEVTEAQYFEIIEKKTASFLAACLELGGVLSGLASPDLEHLRRYGLAFGKAFQIVDDCLDISGEEHVFGKALGVDCEAGVLTLPWIRFRQLAPGTNCSGFQELAGEVAQSGALDYAYAKAQSLVEEARLAACSLAACAPRQALDALLDFVLVRQQ